MEPEGLKPCPFCNKGTSELGWYISDRGNGPQCVPRVICNACHGFGPWGEDFDDAKVKWNCRIPHNFKNESPLPCPWCGETKYLCLSDRFVMCYNPEHATDLKLADISSNGVEGPVGDLWNSRT